MKRRRRVQDVSNGIKEGQTRDCLKDAGRTKQPIQVFRHAAEGHMKQMEAELYSSGDQKRGPSSLGQRDGLRGPGEA